jgi:hypothetical protein
MKQLKFFLAFLLVIGILSSTTSCKKDVETKQVNTSVEADDALAESIYDNATDIANEAYENGSVGLKSTGYFLSGCATVSLDTTVMPRVLTVDFGDENCLCSDGRYRRGKIIATFNGPYWWPGTVITYGFDNYHVNDHHVGGIKVVTNMGFNTSGNMYFNVVVTGIIDFSGGGTLTWNSTTVREWAEGQTTWTPMDDVYLITGSSNGIRPSGETWTRVIVNPLRVEIGCKWIVSGTMEVTPEGLPTRIFDWGNGECDNIATAVINGVTYTILLP